MIEIFTKSCLKLGLVAAAIAAAGCSAEVGAGIDLGEAEGSMTVDWTVANTKDPITCDDFAADTLEIIVFDDFGQIARTDSACDDFEVTLFLPEGVYSVDATMLDSDFVPISTTVSLDGLSVREGTDLEVPIDFPSDSFYY
jgi:hypothetical protein